jgi:hypothetical protein
MEKDLKNIALFKNDPVRRVWDKEKEKWYFSVVDVVANDRTDTTQKIKITKNFFIIIINI